MSVENVYRINFSEIKLNDTVKADYVNKKIDLQRTINRKKLQNCDITVF